MLKQSKNQRTQLTPECASLQLTTSEVVQLKNLAFNAIWYNDECNLNHQNIVLNALLSAKNETNESEIICTIQLLNAVACMSGTLSKLHKNLKKLEDTCDELNIP